MMMVMTMVAPYSSWNPSCRHSQKKKSMNHPCCSRQVRRDEYDGTAALILLLLLLLEQP